MRLHSIFVLFPYLLTWTALVGVQGAPLQCGNSSTIIDADVEAFINRVLQEWKSPGGASVAFVKKDDNGTWTNIEAKGFGRATASGTNVTENTMFNIGSNSKLFTVLATSLLINNETLSPRLNWDSKIKDFIPHFNVTDSVATSEAVLLDLMSHRTGYPRHDFSNSYSDDIPTVIYKSQFLRQSTEFRDNWQYNNNMYTTISYLPSLLVNQTFARYVKEFILDPLGMNQTTYDYNLADAKGFRADGMGRDGLDVYKDPFAGTPRAVKYWLGETDGEDGNVLSGAGGVISSAADMTKWLQVLLLDGVDPTSNCSVVAPGTLEKITSAISLQNGAPEWPEVSLSAYGAAQIQYSYRGHHLIEHGGYIRGFNSQVTRLPNDNFGVAVLTNDHEHGMVMAEIIKNYIVDKTLGLEPVDWNSRYKAQKSILPARATPRPENATLPCTNFTNIAGTYNNEGYGKLELCLLSPENPSPSNSCQGLAANLSTILPGAVRDGIPTLVGAVNGVWFSHIILEHFNADLFNVSLVISTPTNDSSLPYWTFNDQRQSDNTVTAETDVEGDRVAFGISGVWNGLWDGTPFLVPKPTGDTVRERAEAYFEKIQPR